MTRDDALKVSDALAAARIHHVISVRCQPGFTPPARYGVAVTPALSFAASEIRDLQAIAAANGRGICFIGGSFEFTEEER